MSAATERRDSQREREREKEEKEIKYKKRVYKNDEEQQSYY